jgi:hypothetical protein
MKKYLFGMLAIVLALGFSAFTTAKKTLTYTFTIDRIPLAESDVEQTTTISSKLVYANWDRTAGLVTCGSGFEHRSCTIIVDEKYTQDLGGTRYLNAADPDAEGPKVAFPTMDAVVGFTNEDDTYYKVNNSDVSGEIDVQNGKVEL